MYLPTAEASARGRERREGVRGGDCRARQRPVLGQVPREGEGLWARRGGLSRRPRAGGGGRAMARCGRCGQTLLLVWLLLACLPAGE